MIVGCKLPHGLSVSHAGHTIVLNGGNVGFDPDNPWKSGAAPDSPDRISGAGLTVVEGNAAAALKEWMELTAKGHGPVRSGMIFTVNSKTDANKEAQALEGAKTGLDALDPDKDLPKGVSTDKNAKG